MMDFLYGELNYEIIKNKYEGAETTTATTTVDDALSRISVDVKCVPYKLLIINAESGNQYWYQGDVQQQITLHGYSLRDVTLVGSQYLHEYSLIKDNVEFGDRIIVPKDIYVNNIILRICEEENVPYNGAVVGERYLDVTFTNSSNHVYTSLKDFDLRIEEAQSDIDTHVARTDNPHSVTKAQVGLGLVLNKDTDTTATQNSSNYVTSGAVWDKVEELRGNLEDGTTIVKKASKDDEGRNIVETYSIITETGNKISASVDTSTYVCTFVLKDKNNNEISTTSIDLPIESVIISGRYDDATKSIILVLESGDEIDIPVGDLVDGLQNEITAENPLPSDLVSTTNQTNLFVTAGEKSTWNGKQDAMTALTNEQIDTIYQSIEGE